MNDKKIQFEAEPEQILAFKALVEELGMMQKAAGTRLFAWFTSQDDVVQREVLGLLPPSQRPMLAEALVRQMNERSKPVRERLTEAANRLPSAPREPDASRPGQAAGEQRRAKRG